MTRNIKFNFEIIDTIIEELHTTLKQGFGIIDKRALDEIKQKLWERLDDKKNNLKPTRVFKTNFMKKLNYFTNLILSEILRLNVNLIKKEEMLELLYKFIKKKGANYLTQHSLQLLSKRCNNE